MLPIETPPEVIQQVRGYWGLDKPWHVQYWNFMSHAVQGDFGTSFKWPNQNVMGLISSRLVASLQLTVTSLVVASLIALVLGVLTAVKRDTPWDYGGKLFAFIGQSAPSFWTGIMLMWIFAVELDWLPSSGKGGIKHMVLPVATLSAFQVAAMMRLVRSSMLDTLDSEYVKMARIKGLPEWKVVWKHCLRNAAIAPLTYFGLTAGVLLTGSVIVETIFAWPGVGRLIINAVQGRDFQVVQASALVFAVGFILLNLLVDIVYAIVGSPHSVWITLEQTP